MSTGEIQLPETILKPIGPLAIQDALMLIKPGQHVLYHHGRLGIDRKFREEIRPIADLAYRLAGMAEIDLVQLCAGDSGFYYIAVGRQRSFH